jgi:Holliday junction resolvasome RuvABC endonuclease subunit
MKKQVLLTIDASTKSTGWAIFEDTQLTNYGVITATSSNLYKRIDKMITEIDKLVEQYQPTDIVIEEVLPADVRNNNNVFKALIYLQGFICHTLDKYKIIPTFIVASHWRRLCGIKTGSSIKRESLKSKDIAFVKKEYGIDVNDDIADAICIGYATLHEHDNKEDFDGFEFK